MRYVEVGGARMSAVGLGCWQFGSMEWGYGKEYLEKDAIDIVHRALELGVTLIDTAEIYGFGKSERAVGRALEGRRQEAFIATKVFPVLPIAPIVEQRGRASAKRLGLDTIDRYQIHPPNPLVPTSTQIALAWVIKRKNVVAIPGASSVAQLEKNAAAADIELTEEEDTRLTTASDNFNPINGVKALPKIVRKRLPF